MSGTPQARSAYFIGSQLSCQICSRKHSNIRSHVYFPPDSFHRLQSLNRTVVTSLMQYTSNARSAKQYKPTQTYDVRRMRTIKTGIVRTSLVSSPSRYRTKEMTRTNEMACSQKASYKRRSRCVCCRIQVNGSISQAHSAAALSPP